MEKFYTMTEFLRNNILNYQRTLSRNFYSKENYEYEDDDEFIDLNDIDSYDDYQSDLYEANVICKLIDSIENSEYRYMYYLIIFKDVWEYLKTRQIIESSLLIFEKAMIEFLENNDIKDIFNKLETSNDFDLDLITLFIEYHSNNDIENRMKNRKLIELTNNSKYLEKFKISILDDIEYQYIKTRKIY